MQTPYQELSGFHLTLQQQAYHDMLFNRVADQHPDFSRAQIEGVLDGTIQTSGDPLETPMNEGDATPTLPVAQTHTVTSKPYDPASWSKQDLTKYNFALEAAKQSTLQANSPSMVAAGVDGNDAKSNLVSQAQSYTQMASDIEDKYKTIADAKKSGPPVSEIKSMDDLSKLTGGDLFYTKGVAGYADNHLYQKTGLSSDQRAQSDAMVTALKSGKTFTGSTPTQTSRAPGPSDGNASPPLQIPKQFLDLLNLLPQNDQSPATAGIGGNGWQFTPPPEQEQNVDPSTVLTGENLPIPAAPTIPSIVSKSQYDSLPIGAKYKDSNGKLAIKRKR